MLGLGSRRGAGGALPCRQAVPFGPSQGGPCEVGPGAPEPPVGRTLRVVGALTRPRGAAPRCPPTRRGPPFLPRNGGKEGRGQAPWTPFFYAHSLPLVPPFALGGAAGTIYRLLRCPFLAPDLGTFLFWEIFLEQIFFARKSYSKFLYPKKKESRSGYDERDRNSPTIVAMWHRAKSRTSGSEWP